jgi:hypothetical protein
MPFDNWTLQTPIRTAAAVHAFVTGGGGANAAGQVKDLASNAIGTGARTGVGHVQ